MRKVKNIFLILFLCAIKFSSAQDIHFSQFYVTPLLQNPANAGFFNCDYRLIANYKTQWRSVTTPYKTFNASADLKKTTRGNKADFFGFGMDASVDRAGDSRFTTTQIGLVGSLHHSLDQLSTQYFGGGIMLGLTSATIDYTNLLFNDMYGGAPGIVNPTSENIALNSLTYFDMSIGGAYNYIETVKKKTVRNSFTFGAAIYHINKPVKSFKDDANSRVFRKLVVNTGANLHASSRFEFYPRLQYSLQGPNQEFLVGTFLRVNLDKMNNTRYGIYFGPWYRLGDAMIIVTRFDMDNMSISFNYDVNMSGLTEVSNSKGGPELSIIYIGCIPHFNKKYIFCPRF